VDNELGAPLVVGGELVIMGATVRDSQFIKRLTLHMDEHNVTAF
jgi:hypothetical protein